MRLSTDKTLVCWFQKIFAKEPVIHIWHNTVTHISHVYPTIGFDFVVMPERELTNCCFESGFKSVFCYLNPKRQPNKIVSEFLADFHLFNFCCVQFQYEMYCNIGQGSWVAIIGDYVFTLYGEVFFKLTNLVTNVINQCHMCRLWPLEHWQETLNICQLFCGELVAQYLFWGLNISSWHLLPR